MEQTCDLTEPTIDSQIINLSKSFETRAKARPQSLTQHAANEIGLSRGIRHARACPGHPRLRFRKARKTWMAGTSLAMTRNVTHFQGVRRSLKMLAAFPVRHSG
jgi:hypothetical protein